MKDSEQLVRIAIDLVDELEHYRRRADIEKMLENWRNAKFEKAPPKDPTKR